MVHKWEPANIRTCTDSVVRLTQDYTSKHQSIAFVYPRKDGAFIAKPQSDTS